MPHTTRQSQRARERPTRSRTGRTPPTGSESRPRPLRDRVGAAGEAAACAHLQAQGMRILARDWRCPLGQIDAVALDGDTLVIVEVKARRGTGFGLPQEAVDARKRHKLRLLTEAYVQQAGRAGQPVRVDVVALLVDAQLRITRCEHIRDAVSGR